MLISFETLSKMHQNYLLASCPQAAVANAGIIQDTYVIKIFPIAMLKKGKETDGIYFSNISYLTNITILACNQYKTY